MPAGLPSWDPSNCMTVWRRRATGSTSSPSSSIRSSTKWRSVASPWHPTARFRPTGPRTSDPLQHEKGPHEQRRSKPRTCNSCSPRSGRRNTPLGRPTLRRSTLERLGGAQTIVRTHLDQVIAGLTPPQVEVAAAIFHHLVTTTGSKIALTAEDLAEWSGRDVESVRDLLDTLCAGRQRILRPLRRPSEVPAHRVMRSTTT